MIELIETTDLKYLDWVFNDPSIRDAFADDRQAFQVLTVKKLLETPGSHALKVIKDGVAGGWIMSVPLEGEPGWCEVHVAFLPNCRGIAAVEAAYEAIHWHEARFGPLKVKMRVREDNGPALVFNEWCGMKEVGREIGDRLKNGQPMKLVVFERK